jgi:hypothetical protein
MKESGVFSLWRGCRTDRPAIDTGRRDSDEQTSVETRISRFNGAIAGVVVHIHKPIIYYPAAVVSRISDFKGKERRNIAKTVSTSWRDLHTVAQTVTLAPEWYPIGGRIYLGMDPGPRLR